MPLHSTVLEKITNSSILWKMLKFIFWAIVVLILIGLLRPDSDDVRTTRSTRLADTSTDIGEPAPMSRRTIARLVKAGVSIDNMSWRKEGFDNIMEADFKIKNSTDYDVKDIFIKCTHSAASGTQIDYNTHTEYRVFKHRSTTWLREVNMGFIHPQAAKTWCQIEDLTVVSGPHKQTRV